MVTSSLGDALTPKRFTLLLAPPYLAVLFELLSGSPQQHVPEQHEPCKHCNAHQIERMHPDSGNLTRTVHISMVSAGVWRLLQSVGF